MKRLWISAVQGKYPTNKEDMDILKKLDPPFVIDRDHNCPVDDMWMIHIIYDRFKKLLSNSYIGLDIKAMNKPETESTVDDSLIIIDNSNPLF